MVRIKDKTVDSYHSYLRGNAASALGNLGDAAEPYVKDILEIIKDKTVNSYVRGNAASALGNIKQLELKEFPIALNNVYYNDKQQSIAQWRWSTYFLSGGTDDARTLLKWLGRPKITPEKLTRSEGLKTLELFRQTWEVSRDEKLTKLRNDLEQQIVAVAAYKDVPWQPQDITLLQQHYNNLNAVKSPSADKIQSVIINLKD